MAVPIVAHGPMIWPAVVVPLSVTVTTLKAVNPAATLLGFEKATLPVPDWIRSPKVNVSMALVLFGVSTTFN